ncbi:MULTISPECIES: hypothetical protein [unclassified Brenneria]|uniref:hypothetical protein n=1 Tax=unclassified Brenneria TaxID=2634434 RepID=UPI0029C4E57D|nr:MULTISPECIES: hypothetical protein [unclassified Brenneria]MDX5630873.1 hypothetical protein [Brenneria sp. L3-3Z]MDX5697955.1 hypothetical protein [Brenneria sp. L4-2C]
MKGLTLLAGLLTTFFSCHAFSSTDGICGFSDAECGMPAFPYLLPDNDTRTNLMLLQSSRKHIALPVPQPLPDQTRSRIDPFTAYRVMGLAATEGPEPSTDDGSTQAVAGTLLEKARRLQLSPAVQEKFATLTANDGEGRQISNDFSTVEDFFDVLLADQTLTDVQRTSLALARLIILSPDYSPSSLSSELDRLPDEGHAGELKRYLIDTQAFYQGEFRLANNGFQALTQAGQAWVAETSGYMLIRVAINAAMQSALDEYNMFDAAKADKNWASSAIQRIDDYLKQYPRGLYAESAQGLYRRAYWILGDLNALPKIYQQVLDRTDNAGDLQALSDEIDDKLLERETFTAAPDSPLLALVQDLKRLRATRDGGGRFPALSAEELATQQDLFERAGMQNEFHYLQTAWQFYRQKDYAAVVNGVAPTHERDLTDTTRFSLQVLRGQALEHLARWDEAEMHWRRLLSLETGYTQQQYLQLALAETLAKAGHPEKIFTADSPVKNLRFRSAVLKVSADADLLRQQTGPQQTHEERAIALHTLLTKSLTHADYAGYLQDSARRKDIPPLENAENMDWSLDSLAVFDWDGGDTEAGYQCPALQSVVSTLNQRPNDARAINCLGEFFLRTGDIVGFDWGESNMLDELINAPTQFKGPEYNRLDGYLRVIADPAAPPEDKSYALYRAVYCYAPSGFNDCGEQDISKATRKAWFTQLKTEFKGSLWANKLKYYW